MDQALLVDETGASLYGRCGHCGISVDNHDQNHRVSALMRGGRGVECVLRGDIHPSEAAPLKLAPAEGANGPGGATRSAESARATTEDEQ